MSQFILDNTVTMAWCFSDEATSFTEDVLNRLSTLADTAIVPALWQFEVVNVTGLAVRKGRITNAKAAAFLENLLDLPIEVRQTRREDAFVKLPALMERHMLTSYDAAYLELALRQGCPIATLDQALVRACNEAGVSIYAQGCRATTPEQPEGDHPACTERPAG